MAHAPTPPDQPIRRRLPWCTLLLCAATLALSFHAAIEISSSAFGRVRIVQLEPYGLRLQYLRELELWRLVTAQLVHVKQAHMLGSVFTMLWLGAVVERHLGAGRLLMLWLVGGSIATLVSTLFTTPPWNLGTGASQAIMAFAGAGLWLVREGTGRPRELLWPIGLTLTMTFSLDLIFAHYPKPGHLAGLLLGYLMTSFSRRAV